MTAKMTATKIPASQTWTTRDGTVVRIRDMSNDHLGNTLRMLMRLAPHWRAEAAADAWAFAGSLTGDMAIYYAEQGAEQIEDGEMDEQIIADVYPAFPVMLREAERRSLPWMFP